MIKRILILITLNLIITMEAMELQKNNDDLSSQGVYEAIKDGLYTVNDQDRTNFEKFLKNYHKKCAEAILEVLVNKGESPVSDFRKFVALFHEYRGKLDGNDWSLCESSLTGLILNSFNLIEQKDLEQSQQELYSILDFFLDKKNIQFLKEKLKDPSESISARLECILAQNSTEEEIEEKKQSEDCDSQITESDREKLDELINGFENDLNKQGLNNLKNEYKDDPIALKKIEKAFNRVKKTTTLREAREKNKLRYGQFPEKALQEEPLGQQDGWSFERKNEEHRDQGEEKAMPKKLSLFSSLTQWIWQHKAKVMGVGVLGVIGLLSVFIVRKCTAS